MKQVGISGDFLEWKRQREDFEYAQKMHLNGDFSSVSVPMESDMSEPGRCYYAKRVGRRWQVWFCHSDVSPDPHSGATEWLAASTKFWRWISAARIANDMRLAFNEGVRVGGGREIEAANRSAPASTTPTVTDDQER